MALLQVWAMQLFVLKEIAYEQKSVFRAKNR